MMTVAVEIIKRSSISKPLSCVLASIVFFVREQTTTDVNIGEKVAKDGVHACVLRIFFLCIAQLCICLCSSLLRSGDIVFQQHRLTNTTVFLLLVLYIMVVREQTTTDVNIERESCEKMVYMRVCSAFFSFFYAQLCKLSDF